MKLFRRALPGAVAGGEVEALAAAQFEADINEGLQAEALTLWRW